jgi:hypothetical protein
MLASIATCKKEVAVKSMGIGEEPTECGKERAVIATTTVSLWECKKRAQERSCRCRGGLRREEAQSVIMLASDDA